VDVLVNNAGLYLEIAGPAVRDRTSVFDARMEVVRAILETNLLGPLSLSQGLIPVMRERGYGRVVNVTSAMGQLSENVWPAPSASGLFHLVWAIRENVSDLSAELSAKMEIRAFWSS
jgi:NAD(P)-dependent dehydrogenase (short-subunit alcohol dehydrogenase family)